MSIENPIPEADMKQLEHDDVSGTLKCLMYGQTTSGETLAIVLNDDGTI